VNAARRECERSKTSGYYGEIKKFEHVQRRQLLPLLINSQCPLYPRKQTLLNANTMSAKCQ
jgi:hypothetical protein